MVKVRAFKCLLCGDVVYSRVAHDYRSCFCKNVSVDGGSLITVDGEQFGSFHSRILIRQKSQSEMVDCELNIEAQKSQHVERIFYNDWNKSIDNYGIIRDNKYNDDDRIAAKAKLELL